MTCEGTSDDLIGEALLIGVVEDQVKNATTEVDISSLSLPKPKPITNSQDQRLVEQLADTIRVIGDRLDQDQRFNDMIDGLVCVADKSSFWKLVEKVFCNEQITWGRIIVLFYSVGKLSVKMVLAHLPAVFTDILNLSLDFFRRKLLQWICNMGGWTAALTLDLRKHSGPTPADDMAPQTITDCGNFTRDLKQRGFCACPLFLQTLGP
ncbi:apoptosis regulator BAX-like isoform X1 [Hoplias malabaricus]|uniref:apoptosis regulator BAX-like isoform X1 n=1 Tax=Hoplias malabaricus TaxID=27720 RepID=UPI0034618128